MAVAVPVLFDIILSVVLSSPQTRGGLDDGLATYAGEGQPPFLVGDYSRGRWPRKGALSPETPQLNLELTWL
jgi:hypothetical protein